MINLMRCWSKIEAILFIPVKIAQKSAGGMFSLWFSKPNGARFVMSSTTSIENCFWIECPRWTTLSFMQRRYIDLIYEFGIFDAHKSYNQNHKIGMEWANGVVQNTTSPTIQYQQCSIALANINGLWHSINFNSILATPQ